MKYTRSKSKKLSFIVPQSIQNFPVRLTRQFYNIVLMYSTYLPFKKKCMTIDDGTTGVTYCLSSYKSAVLPTLSNFYLMSCKVQFFHLSPSSSSNIFFSALSLASNLALQKKNTFELLNNGQSRDQNQVTIEEKYLFKGGFEKSKCTALYIDSLTCSCNENPGRCHYNEIFQFFFSGVFHHRITNQGL